MPRCYRCFRDAVVKMLITHPYTKHSPKFTEHALPDLPTELTARERLGRSSATLKDVLGTCGQDGRNKHGSAELLSFEARKLAR